MDHPHLQIIIAAAVLSFGFFTEAQIAHFHLGSQPSDLAVSSSGQVFIATGSQLLRLEGNITLTENVTMGNDLLNIASSSDGGRLVACLSDRSCAVYNANNLGGGPELQRTDVSAAKSMSTSSVPLALFTEPSGSFYTGSYGEFSAGTTRAHVVLNQYGFADANFTRSSRATRYSSFRDISRDFITGFVEGSNGYYFVVDNSGFRVLRVCHINKCAGSTEECEVTALYEAELRCGNLVSATLCGVSLLESYADSSEATIIVALCDGGRHDFNRICAFTLSAIDSALDMRFMECSTAPQGTKDDANVVWDFSRNCNEWQDGVHDNCNFPFALGTPTVSGRRLIHLTVTPVDFGSSDRADRITASLALNVASNTLLYVAFTTDNGNFLTAYHITDEAAILGSQIKRFSDEEMENPVRQLEWAEGLDYIYATTDSNVLRIPIEECSNFTDCESCIRYGNPLCGWCTVEYRCSRMSQCQNASKMMRWVQESNQCISVSISPSQFVKEDPKILNVTVNPGLPPLLPGESFDCYFANTEGQLPPIQVEAVSITNTTYTCNITGGVPNFSGIQLVTDFSFISSEAEVPFGTRESTVTLYDCPAAERCSECVETNNACGWCVFYSRCSGTPSTCNNEWIRVDETGNFTEVCPLLEPSPSSSGDYVHPVVVDRDLELRTKNLPEPIGAFRYQCQLGSLTLNATLSESIICLVSDHQIMLPNEVSGSESVNVDIVWVNADDNIQYTIDTLTRAQVNVALYDCSQLAEGCSQCIIARNMNEFDCGWCNDGDRCSVEEQCPVANMFSTTSSGCPSPMISSFSPTSGPLEGGTTIAIHGTDLGTSLEEVMMGEVRVGSTPCIVQESGYIPGQRIVCETTTFPMTGTGNVIVSLQREGGVGFDVSTGIFNIVSPTISEVDPEFGPESGGTAVTVRGTFLDSGNIEVTRITLVGENETDCRIGNLSNISANEIKCTTLASMDGISSVSVVVYIDNAVVDSTSVNFVFKNDPNFTAVDPMRIIPAGGIQLIFSGQYLDSVQRPMFVVTDSRYTTPPQLLQYCSVVNEQQLECIAPRLDGPSQSENLDYTLIVDNAPGPDSNSESLTLAVVPNPTFENGTALDPKDIEYQEHSGKLITIRGQNLDSVDPEEIQVEVGGDQCMIQSVSSQQILCEPPQTVPNGMTEVNVLVFIGTKLSFLAGTMTYVSTTTDSGLSVSTTVVAAVVPAVIVLLIATVVIVVMVVGVLRWQSVYKARHISKEELQLEPMSPTALTPRGFVKQIPKKLIIPCNRLQLQEIIGQGEFGAVYRAQLTRQDGQGWPKTVAVKSLKGLFTPNDVMSMMDEIMKMQCFDHPHVMTLMGVCLDAGPGVSIIMPYMANGSLLDYLKKERVNLVLTEESGSDAASSVRKLLLRFCHQIAQGMEYLALQKFVHRDLAARNCMLDHQGSVKVADFGLAEDMYAKGYFRQGTDTFIRLPYKWMPPESLQDMFFSEKSDVWAFGVTCWEIFMAGKTPYPAINPVALSEMLKSGLRLGKPSNAACSEEIYLTMQKCWYTEPDARPTFSELVSIHSTMLESVAGYVELNMGLPAPTADEEEIEMEKNPMYGIHDDIPMERNPVYGTSLTTN